MEEIAFMRHHEKCLELEKKKEACALRMEQEKDPRMKQFYTNAWVGYMYKIARLEDREPVTDPRFPYRADGNYIGVTVGGPEPGEFDYADSMTLYEYDADGNIIAYAYWNMEGEKCYMLLD